MQQAFVDDHDKQAALLFTQQLPISACKQQQIALCILHTFPNVL